MPFYLKSCIASTPVAHSTNITDEDMAVLKAMAAQDVRRCPNCHYIVIKDGGCPLMMCDQCDHEYSWQEAEKIKAPRSTADEIKEGRPPQDELCEMDVIRAAQLRTKKLTHNHAPLVYGCKNWSLERESRSEERSKRFRKSEDADYQTTYGIVIHACQNK
jgi:hypothetical protein